MLPSNHWEAGSGLGLSLSVLRQGLECRRCHFRSLLRVAAGGGVFAHGSVACVRGHGESCGVGVNSVDVA